MRGVSRYKEDGRLIMSAKGKGWVGEKPQADYWAIGVNAFQELAEE